MRRCLSNMELYRCSYREDNDTDFYRSLVFAFKERKSAPPRKICGRDLFAVRMDPGRYLVEFLLETTRKPWPLARALQVLSEYKVDVLNINSQTFGDKNISFILADFTESAASPQEIEKALREDPFLQASKVKFTVPELRGVFCEAFGFPLTIDGGRMPVMVIGRTMLLGMLRTVRELFGTGGDVIVYKQAFEGAIRVAKYFKERLAGLSAIDLLRWHLNTLFSMGWGVFNIEVSNGVLIVRSEEHFESSEAQTYPGSGCTFTRGYLAGIASVYFEKQVEIQEVKCKTAGDPLCEFHLKI